MTYHIFEDDMEPVLRHYGTPRRSGRYPWGTSGWGAGEGSQRNMSFLDMIDELKSEGMTESDIAKYMGMESTTQLRAQRSIASNARRQHMINQVEKLSAKGMSNAAISRQLDLPDSTVRSYLAPGARDKASALTATADMLRDQVKQKGMVDVGTATEYQVGISRNRLTTAVAILKEEGYDVHYVKIPQSTTGKETTQTVLVPPGQSYKETYANRDKVQQLQAHSDDNGRSYTIMGVQEPLSISPSRLAVRYDEDGGSAADGVVYVRPGVKDVSLGDKQYAQVRIKIGKDHYIKGMAMYDDNLPDGVDLMFNTNKKKANVATDLDALKKLKDDPDNPFGSNIKKQLFDDDGKVSSAMNIVNEEADWDDWSRNLSTQILSKQKPILAETQLRKTYDESYQEYEDIRSLTNPTVKRKLLEAHADGADAAAVHLKAAKLPRQSTHVILPINSLKDNEVYAPNFKDGERVVLIRHPHAGRFEIPEVTVNNRHPQAKKALGNAPDAIGINSKVAAQLSGADFDGDAVVVIPNNSRKIQSESPLRGLNGFDPQKEYPGYEGMKTMDARTKGVEMGKVSNLITDMTIRGAPHADLERAVRHSMVVIDAEKHGLDWKESERKNAISALKKEYQAQDGGSMGASTLISRASAEIRVPDRVLRRAADGGPVDKATGRRVFVETGETYTNKQGKVVPRTTKSKRLAETEDAFTLSSGTKIEEVYANHSNRMKKLALDARKEAVNTPPLKYNRDARVAYQKEVDSLSSKLRLADSQRPYERQAQQLANAEYRLKRQAKPEMDKEEQAKVKRQTLKAARERVGVSRQVIDITPDEWDAIQAGAISDSRLRRILDRADMDQIREYATPRKKLLMSSSNTARAKAMLASGRYTQAEVASALGVSLTTLKTAL